MAAKALSGINVCCNRCPQRAQRWIRLRRAADGRRLDADGASVEPRQGRGCGWDAALGAFVPEGEMEQVTCVGSRAAGAIDTGNGVA